MRRFLLAGLFAFLLLPAVAAAKQPPLTFLTYSESGIRGLGPYRGYYESPKGTLQIVDAQAGTTRAVVLPNGCENRGINGPDVLLGCGEGYRIWNSWTGETTPVDLSSCGSYARSIQLGQLGRYWIAGGYDTGYENIDQGREFGYEVYWAVYINRRTGKCRVSDEHDFNRNVDRADLPAPRYGEPDRCARGKKFILRSSASRGTDIKRCTPRARWRFVTSNYGSVFRGPNLVAWMEGARLHAYVVDSRRRLSWRVPGAAGRDSYTFPTVLGDRVYANVARNDPKGLPIYTVDLSGVVRR